MPWIRTVRGRYKPAGVPTCTNLPRKVGTAEAGPRKPRSAIVPTVPTVPTIPTVDDFRLSPIPCDLPLAAGLLVDVPRAAQDIRDAHFFAPIQAVQRNVECLHEDLIRTNTLPRCREIQHAFLPGIRLDEANGQRFSPRFFLFGQPNVGAHTGTAMARRRPSQFRGTLCSVRGYFVPWSGALSGRFRGRSHGGPVVRPRLELRSTASGDALARLAPARCATLRGALGTRKKSLEHGTAHHHASPWLHARQLARGDPVADGTHRNTGDCGNFGD